MRNKIYDTVLALSAVALSCSCMTSCKSSRHTSRGDRYIPTEQTHINHSQSDYTQGITGISDRAKEVVKEARRWLGTKYTYGGHSRKGTDCSGLVMEVYRSACGMKLPRTTTDQRAFCKNIDRRNLSPGDLVFFTSRRSGRRISHVGLYIGKGEMIHASSSRGVIVSRLDEKYYIDNYHSSGRIIDAPDNPGIDRDNLIPTPDIAPETVAPTVIASGTTAVPEAAMSVTPDLKPISPAAGTTPPQAPSPDDLLDDILTLTIDSIYATSPSAEK